MFQCLVTETDEVQFKLVVITMCPLIIVLTNEHGIEVSWPMEAEVNYKAEPWEEPTCIVYFPYSSHPSEKLIGSTNL